MYFPVGWPKCLSVGQGKKSCLKYVVCNRYRMLFVILTETTVSVWHCQPCVEIVCYQRCHSSVASVGTNELAEWRQDSSMLAVTTTGGYVLLYQLEQDVKGEKGLNLYEYLQTKTNQGDSNETVPALRLSLKSNVNYKVQITSLTCVHDELLVTLMDGRLEILSWENPNGMRKLVALSDIPFSVDMHLSGTRIKSHSVHPAQAIYSPFLEGFALVLSDGRAALVTMTQSSPAGTPDTDDEEEPKESGWNARGIWAPSLSEATCVSVNNKYRLLAFGTKRGDCCVYAIDDVSRSLQPSHTISLSPTQYPNICKSVGPVLKMAWSPDGCALALSWLNGGLSLWSVFGSCLFCTFSSDRAYACNGSPNMQGIFRSMCWGVEGYNLWLIESVRDAASSATSRPSQHTDYESDSLNSSRESVDGVSDRQQKSHRKTARRKLIQENGEVPDRSARRDAGTGQLLQIQFAKSALAMNPCMSNHCHVLLHSEDRIYLSLGERPQIYSIANSATDRSYLSKKEPGASPAYTGTFASREQHDVKPHNSPRRRSAPGHLTASGSYTQDPLINNHSINTIDESPSIDTTENDGFLGSAVANKQWTIIQFPLNYLPSNWPIRFVAVDETGCFVAVAGNFGLAHYTVTSRKWKVFGNVMQEKDMVVTGGLTWWDDHIVVACYNLSENQDEIRLYPRLTNLDNAFACIRKMKSQILLVDVFQNLLILFTYDCRISIFVLSHDIKQHRSIVSIRFLQELTMARYVSYPTLVASVTFTALHMESAIRRSSSSTSGTFRPQKETEVLIVNVAGRLLLLHGTLEDEEVNGTTTDDESLPTAPSGRRQTHFSSPVVLASCVENIWTTQHKNRAKVHLTDALWLGCGSAGVRVWLPLFPPRQSRHSSSDGASHRGFELQLLTARRITLAFSLDSCYPLAVLFNEAVVLGITSETGFEDNLSTKGSKEKRTSLQFATVERTCEIYLHQILRQLLRRNLGYHALQLAATCQSLSCFPHVLELMLHEVLEEEATASEPIPDPLLPTVIKFLEEFPEYLQTVVHCARKTEIALWEYLFNSVGSPRELFEECLEIGQLQTAASYLIILQNLEQLSVARQDATRLFDQALQKKQWQLANEIARFLRAIVEDEILEEFFQCAGDGDACATPRHPTLLNANIYPAVAPASLHGAPAEPDPAFKFSVPPPCGEERKNVLARQYSVAANYYDMSSTFAQRRCANSRSAPNTPAIVPLLSGYSSSKSQSSNPSSPDDPPSSTNLPPGKRLSARSYTESYFDLLHSKSSSSPSAVTSLGGQSSNSSSNKNRYTMRQYHQDHQHVHRPLQVSVSHPLSASSNRFKRFPSDKDHHQSKEHAAAECAEHYFLDVILARQARKMLSEKRLHDLGTFAACVNFQLVPWLRKERCRACRVDDAVASLKALHDDFSWPFPAVFPGRNSRGSNSSSSTPSHSRSFHDLGSLQNRFGSLEVGGVSPSRSMHFNNSLSPKSRNPMPKFPNLPVTSPKRNSHLDTASLGTDDDGATGSGVLTVLSARETGSTWTLTSTVASEMSEVSESSLTFDDASFGASAEDAHSFMAAGSGLDDKRGPARYEMQLRYLLELFLEALCLEWAILVCLMLRDPSYTSRLVRSARSANPSEYDDDAVPLETLQRTRDCLAQIDKWSISECSGYKAVLVSIRAQLQELSEVINAREVAHAERQAIIAKQTLCTTSAPAMPLPTNISIDRLARSNSAASVVSSASAQSATSSTTRKKRVVPGTAVHYSETIERVERIVNGTDSGSSSEVETILPSDDQLDHPPPTSLCSARTRHNSVPCEQSTGDAAKSDTAHARTPSSPAKLHPQSCGTSKTGADSDSLSRTSSLDLVEIVADDPSRAPEADDIDEGGDVSCSDSDDELDSEEMSDSKDESACVVS